MPKRMNERREEPITPDRKYRFSWSLLRNLAAVRPNLGNTTRLEVYRLMQFCFRDALEQYLGAEQTDRIFSTPANWRDAGFTAI
jgi:hypothetical protein